MTENSNTLNRPNILTLDMQNMRYISYDVWLYEGDRHIIVSRPMLYKILRPLNVKIDKNLGSIYEENQNMHQMIDLHSAWFINEHKEHIAWVTENVNDGTFTLINVVKEEMRDFEICNIIPDLIDYESYMINYSPESLINEYLVKLNIPTENRGVSADADRDFYMYISFEWYYTQCHYNLFIRDNGVFHTIAQSKYKRTFVPNINYLKDQINDFIHYHRDQAFHDASIVAQLFDRPASLAEVEGFCKPCCSYDNYKSYMEQLLSEDEDMLLFQSKFLNNAIYIADGQEGRSYVPFRKIFNVMLSQVLSGFISDKFNFKEFKKLHAYIEGNKTHNDNYERNLAEAHQSRLDDTAEVDDEEDIGSSARDLESVEIAI